MDTEMQILFNCIHEEVVQLFYRWKIFRQLFGSGEENLKLLNKSGSNIFALLQRLTEDNVSLTLCRLTDPERTGSYENLSIRNFLGRIGAVLDAKVRGDLHGKLARLEAATEMLRIHRSKRIAHLDLNHALKPELLPSLRYDDLQDAMKILESIMKDLHLIVFNADTSYKEPAVAYGCDGEYLLRILRDAHNRQNDNEKCSP
jgi:AbiU2